VTQILHETIKVLKKKNLKTYKEKLIGSETHFLIISRHYLELYGQQIQNDSITFNEKNITRWIIKKKLNSTKRLFNQLL